MSQTVHCMSCPAEWPLPPDTTPVEQVPVLTELAAHMRETHGDEFMAVTIEKIALQIGRDARG